jgi:uncharacterized membrane protein YphA (DoxX/SURF4 family)
MHKVARVGLWVCQAALALLFVFAGSAKFTSPMWERMFARWGYPDQFYLVIGAVEVAAGLALLIPRLAASAAAVLIIVMIGAGVTHVLHDELRRLPEIAVMLVMLGLVAYGRRADVYRRKAARAPA